MNKLFSKKKIILPLILTALLTSASLLASCGSESSSGSEKLPDPFAGRDPSIVLGYDGMEGYQGDIMFVDTTVAEVAEMMDKGETFVVFASFEDCPWCNLLISHLNDAARDAGVHVGYIDTRLKPEWTNNMDIDDYDLFVEKFGDWLSEDEDGKLHLYTPDTYFIKNGKVVARHDGVTPGVDDPNHPLTSEQEEQLKKDLESEFSKLK